MGKKKLIDGIIINNEKIIEHEKGDIFHIMKKSQNGFHGFGEVYLSKINFDCVKAWKKHSKMICNFVVVSGKVKIVIFDGRTNSISKNCINEFVLSDQKDNYFRLTIPNGVWYGFKGLSNNENTLLNFSNIEHDPEEQINKPLGFIKYKW